MPISISMLFRGGLALLACAVVSAASQADVVGLLPHRAIYDLSLKHADPGSGIADARGLMVMEWVDACEGHTLNQRLHVELVRQEGPMFISDSHMSSWESKDGAAFRFSSRSEVNGRLDEAVDGHGMLEPAGGHVVFTKPAGGSLTLPKGTLFPTRHAVLLLDRAAAGDRHFTALVFDGAHVDSLREVVAFIGRRKEAGKYEGAGRDLLGPLASWAVQLAFYPTGRADGVPEYEVGYLMFANGVVADAILDYGDFALSGRLTSVSELPVDC
jgi:hypothetical protein